MESSWSFVYSSTAQIREWTCPLSGYYELEAMGARGGSTDSFEGGKGADVAGMVYITEGQKLYIYLGQSGGLQSGSDKPTIFNGGGSYTGGTATSATARFTSGGGATDFALKNATWNSEDHLYSRILVAGGGGGALYYKPSGSPISGDGGAGGGEAYEPTSRAEYEGETGLGGNLPGKGGTISAGGAVSNSTSSQAGSFGKGGNYGGSVSGGCGGGGWFGGGSGAATANYGSGGGGSSFIFNTANISKSGISYRSSLKTPDSGNFFNPATLEITPTILVKGGSSDVNGQARITYKSAE